MNNQRPFRKPFLLLGIAMSLTGCQSFGPDELRGTRPLYNAAIADSQNEQFIQNIVRLHYRDTPLFLDVTSVTASLKMDLTGGLDQSAFSLNTASELLQITAMGSYTTSPTISYQPLQGEAFVKSMLKAVTLEDMFALIGSGWRPKRVLSLCLERMNNLENAPIASGPTPKHAPKHLEPFKRLLELFDEVTGENLIIPRVNPVTKKLELEINSSPEFHDQIVEIKQLLGLDQNMTTYNVNVGYSEHRKDTISFHLRSLMGIFFFLSQQVDTSKADRRAGLVTVTHNLDGSEFNWDKTAGGNLFRIHQSETEPGMAFVAVPYRGQWFYIADDDLDSKSTFMLLTQLFRMQAGAAKSEAPTLTIPVR